MKAIALLVLCSFAFPILLIAQTGGSDIPQNPSQLLAEALQQAIGLEKLPDAEGMLNSDTIYAKVLYYAPSDSVDQDFSDFLPRHIDKWWLSKITPVKMQENCASPHFRYLLFKMAWQTEDTFSIIVYCQPCGSGFIDRGALRLSFKLEHGLWSLQSTVAFYG